MKVIETIKEMKAIRRKLPEPVGFVPTMGYLHEGHMSLVRYAKKENTSVVVSIFVNPTQFGPKEDFASYPRNTQRDLTMLEKEKTDIVFMPSVADMYPQRYSTWVDVEKVTERLEGAVRPGHFRGVATVVTKLFNIVEPAKAYFGQKDAQQCVVIKKMATDLNMNLDVVILPTAREPDGLAMSSRNTYLDPEQRKAAGILYKSLTHAQKLYDAGERDAEKLRQEIIKILKTEPLANIEYVSVADTETLEELSKITVPAVVSMVVKIGKPRLLDNIILK